MEVGVVTKVRTSLGESPMWSVTEQALYWTDWKEGCLFRTDAGAAFVDEWVMPDTPGSLAPRQTGGLIMALAHGFGFFCPATGEAEFLLDPDPANPLSELNDGKCDRQGRFWAGTMDPAGVDAIGAWYCLDSDHTCRRLINGVVMANGPAWSPDGRTMYVADSGKATILAYEYEPETGVPSKPRTFAHVDPPGVPDGATVDCEGFLWSAHFGAGCLVRYEPSGTIDRIVDLPISQPTSCMFGGPDLATLYVTTARHEMGAEQEAREPLAGRLLALDVGVAGLPEMAFGG